MADVSVQSRQIGSVEFDLLAELVRTKLTTHIIWWYIGLPRCRFGVLLRCAVRYGSDTDTAGAICGIPIGVLQSCLYHGGHRGMAQDTELYVESSNPSVCSSVLMKIQSRRPK